MSIMYEFCMLEVYENFIAPHKNIAMIGVGAIGYLTTKLGGYNGKDPNIPFSLFSLLVKFLTHKRLP